MTVRLPAGGVPESTSLAKSRITRPVKVQRKAWDAAKGSESSTKGREKNAPFALRNRKRKAEKGRGGHTVPVVARSLVRLRAPPEPQSQHTSSLFSQHIYLKTRGGKVDEQFVFLKRLT